MKDALGEIGLVSDIDDLSGNSSIQCNSDPNDSLQVIGQRGGDGSNRPGVVELLQIVDALFDLAPALDERIDQILERQNILEMGLGLPVDLRAIVVTVASKFPQAPDRLVLVVAEKILENRNRLQGKVYERPVAANPKILSPNARRLFRKTHSQGSLGRDSGLGSSLGSNEMPSRWGPDPRSQQTAQTFVPLVSHFLIPPVDVSVAVSSLASSMCSDSGNTQLVQRPACGSDGFIECRICQQRLPIANDQDWK